MTGRHSSRRGSDGRRTGGRALPLPLVAGVAALALVGGAAVVGLTLNNKPEGAAVGVACKGELDLPVTADPSIAPALRGLAQDYRRSEPSVDGVCVSITVQSTPSFEVAEALSTGSRPAPALWVPDAAAWATRVGDRVAIDNLGSLATSPLVIVAPRAAADQVGWPKQQPSWKSVLGEGAKATIADPMKSAAGLDTLLAVSGVLGTDDGATQQLVGAMVKIAQSTLPSTTAGFDLIAKDPAEAPWFTASEQAVWAHNSQDPTAPVAAMYPTEGTLIFDYPALSLADRAEEPQLATAVKAFVEMLQAADSREKFLAAGFRGVDGSALDSATTEKGVVPAVPTALPTPEPEAVSGLMRQWAALTLKSRLLAVIDVSGSMREKAPGGRTRIELAVEASKAALGLFPDGSDIGLWAFSILQDPPKDYVELIPLGPLTSQYEGVPRRQALVRAVDSLPSRARGGTGLYDTTLAAFRAVRNTYEPSKVNTVVLMTDGRNEDDPGSIDLETLLRTLQTESDPARPVPVITIGIGPEADMDALTKISEVTGGKAYSARDPNDIRQVFLDAMVERQCRPNC